MWRRECSQDTFAVGFGALSMIRDEYETDICARLDEAKAIPFERVAIGHWHPKVSDCHANVDTWVAENPSAKAIRGWIIYAGYGEGFVGLTAHSIVEAANGQRFDITPLHDESMRFGARFVEHDRDEKSFIAMKDSGIEIRCLGKRPAPKLASDDVLAIGAQPYDEEEFSMTSQPSHSD